jgi:micrococcal nuclease
MPAARIQLIFTLALVFTPLACAGGQQESRVGDNCLVRSVTDGDTFRCSDGRRVRLIGIDSPESRQQPYGGEARKALMRLLPAGASVRLEADVAPLDRYGRVLAHVWVDTMLVNEVMVRDGWALLYTVPPDVKYVDRLTRAQNEARAHRAGLWSERGFECLPSEFRRKRCVSRP